MPVGGNHLSFFCGDDDDDDGSGCFQPLSVFNIQMTDLAVVVDGWIECRSVIDPMSSH